MALMPGFEPRPHWFKAIALTTAPTLLPLQPNSQKSWYRTFTSQQPTTVSNDLKACSLIIMLSSFC